MAVRIFQRQKPFKAYLIEFAGGTTIEVYHPEALVFHKDVVLYRDSQGIYSLFDWQNVTRFVSRRMRT
jgi:hypothetical protein